MLLDGVNHIAWISKDVDRLAQFYAAVFDAVVGPTRDHGPGETMTVIDIGPATQLNIFVIDGNAEADRQTPMWGRGRIDHIGLAAASQQLSGRSGAGWSTPEPATARSTTSARP